MRPSLVLLAGPNGAGKSTLYQTSVAPSFVGPFIKANLIQQDELKDADHKPLVDRCINADLGAALARALPVHRVAARVQKMRAATSGRITDYSVNTSPIAFTAALSSKSVR